MTLLPTSEMQSFSSSAVPESTPSQAPEHPLPQTSFYSVEYPGYVRSTSVPLAVNNLGGQAALDSAFRRAASKTDTLLELKLRSGQPFAHSIPGDVVGTNNILLKIVKKRRKKRPEGDLDDGAVGEYTAEAVGIINKTSRFRSEHRHFLTFHGTTFAKRRHGRFSIST